jgi:predicted ferric reductase
MSVTRMGTLLLILLAILFLIVGALAIHIPFSDVDTLRLFIRLSALYGFLMMAIAAIMTPFLSTIYRIFGRPFLTIHHIFAAFGVVLATLHPVAFAIQIMNPAVFLPKTQSWIDFWANAGRPALILLYIALAGALLRTKWKQWRYSHALMYVVLLFVIVHGNLVGTDFASIEIRILYNGIFAAVVVAFFLGIRKKLQKRKKESSSLR